MTRQNTIGLVLLLILFLLLGFPQQTDAAEPERGQWVPADIGTKIHPFIEQLKFNSEFQGGQLVEQTEKGWRVRLTVEDKSAVVEIPYNNINLPIAELSAGEHVLVKSEPNIQVKEYLVVDYDRRYRYLLVILASLALCALVGGWITIRSMSGVIIGLVFFIYWTLPAIQSGSSVLLQIGLFYGLVTVLVLPSSLGWNKKAISAVLTALVTGLISVVLLELMANWIGVVGLRNETLQVIEYATRYFPDRVADINLRSMVVGATLIGSLGVILDVSVDVTSSAAEISSARPDLSFTEMLKRTITVSTRLVGTMTNTLLLAYVGTDLFLILTIYILPESTWITLNQDFVAMEVLRGLGGALGFLSAVPLAVVFYALFFKPASPEKPDAPD